MARTAASQPLIDGVRLSIKLKQNFRNLTGRGLTHALKPTLLEYSNGACVR